MFSRKGEDGDLSKPKSRKELIEHKEAALQRIDNFIGNLINTEQRDLCGKADKFSYWIKDYINFLEFEPKFNSSKLRRYKRGEIIKVHLGYNIGSEQGGLHYCIVLDKNNSIHMPVITVVPLSSVKEDIDIEKIHRGEVFLGNELFTSLSSKTISQKTNIDNEIESLKELLTSYDDENCDNSQTKDLLIKRLKELDASIFLLSKMQKEIQKMRKGSIADVSQITTISKIRIYDPKTDNDVLSNIKLSNESLDKIDKCICELYTGTI